MDELRGAVRVLALAGALAACQTGRPPALPEVFQTEEAPELDLDSVAVWPGGDPPWLLATAKATHAVRVFDALTGALIGQADANFQRPNGIAVAGRLAFVVERDAHQVQVIRLPELTSLATFGGDVLRRPYGIAVSARTAAAGPPADDAGFDAVDVWITDNYEAAGGALPRDEQLGERVHRFRVVADGGAIRASHLRSFGDTSGGGTLRKVESIQVDLEQGLLLIAEEEPTSMGLKVYDLDGRFTGRVVGTGQFQFEPEGIVLYRCGQGGYWVATDQDETRNRFLVFDRRTLEYLGAFTGRRTLNTDGVGLSQHIRLMSRFPGGAFYAAHDDRAVSALAWDDIAEALGLDVCPFSDGGEVLAE